MLHIGVNPNFTPDLFKGQSPLIWTINNPSIKNRKIDLQIINVLLENGSNIEQRDKHGNTALLWAIHQKNIQAVQLLIDAGANVNTIGSRDITPLQLARQKNLPEIEKLLIDAGAIE